ncbi:MAG: TPM domain-containing protein [Sphingomonas sp.]|uniref:TPM domain-containing protein n=1 Tax=Sphingomonas sp. TaxID=28214 RepID=UPI0025E9015B|nr:TPM domain-containing protein [Sphingomonas sp.]MBX3565666.1 TPM domain-containing protein [Sphingomonas sp.]
MKTLRLLLCVMAALFGAAIAQAQNFPERGREPVVDAAKLLSPEQVAELTRLSEGINKDTTRQFVVATIPDLEGYDIADYGYQLGRKWGLGEKDANNGIILIVAPNDRKVRIEVGYGLEPIMTDALSSQIINQIIIPKFKAGDMPGGIVAGAQAIGEQMTLPLEAAEAKAKEAVDKAGATRSRNGGDSFPFGLLFIGIVVAFVVLPMMFGGRRGRRYRGGGDNWPIILWSIANEIGRNSGGSGGSGWGGGGGSDWGGGGGGGFSGGGGSFGGGGASGSW